MGNVAHAFTAFFDHVRAIAWTPVLLALACQLLKTGARSRAWRNALVPAYPNARVRWRSVFGASVAGAGVNAIVPVRGGDALKLFILKRRVDGATYPTLASSLFVLAIADIALSALLLAWALESNVLPGVHVLHRLPSVDWFWLFQHPHWGIAVAGVAVGASFALGLWAAAKLEAFRDRVAQGVAVLHTPGRYLRTVAAWQVVDWALRLAATYFYLRAFHIAANLDNALRVQVTQSLSTIVPLTPAGIGTEQALVVYVLAGQASRTALLSLSVGMKAISSALSVVLGGLAIALMLRTLHWRRAVERDEAASTAETPR
jgi:uncharacterized membrane protein YbhN (UPF0104 family)